MRILRPGSVEEAVRIRADEPRARFAAGATALQIDWRSGAPRPAALIDLGFMAKGPAVLDGRSLVIPAATPLSDILEDPLVARHAPLLVEAVAGVAAPGVRSMATIGGNLAWRRGCAVPALLAMDASLRIAGVVDDAPLSSWLERSPVSALIEAVVIPPRAGRTIAGQRKIGLREGFTPSLIGVAGEIALEGDAIVSARLAVGGGATPPARIPAVEALLAGATIADLDRTALLAALMRAIAAPDDDLASAAYRREAAARALLDGLLGSPASAAPRRMRRPSTNGPAPGVRLSHEALPARWSSREDLPAKIAGAMRYMTDHRADGMLVGRILRAAHPHARILSIDASAAEALPGVAAVVTHRDVPGLNAFGIVIQDQPALCADRVRYLGDAVAAVAAADEATAERALSLIEVAYDPLPVVEDMEAALEPDAPAVHPRGNLLTTIRLERGDLAAGFAAAAHVVEETYVTPRQMHAFMETEGGWAAPTADGGLEIHAGGQYGHRDRLQLSRILAIPEDRIRVVTSPSGGAFGGKDELTVQPALALLALKAGRPVRLRLSREESVLAGTKRHPMRIRMRTACDAKGRLLAQEVEAIADAGAYASLGPGVIETAMEHACGPYEVASVRSVGRLAYTNNGVCGAFRGFGANQMTYAIECQIDRLAALCGLDPVEMRRRNLRAPGAPGYLGQTVAPSERLAEMLDAAAASPLWRAAAGDAPAGSLVGVGMALNHQGEGLGTLPPDAGAVRLRLAPDGAIEALYGLDEIGQGLVPAIRSCVSAALGCAREDVRPIFGDTAAAPDSGSTTAARGIYVIWKGVDLAGPAFSDRLRAAAAKALGLSADEIAIVPGGVARRGANSGAMLARFRDLADRLAPEALPEAEAAYPFPKSDYVAGNARFLFSSGATLARVAIDRATGRVRVLDLELHTACGPVIDLASYLGQIEGGAVQGLGFTLSEDLPMRGGAPLALNLDGYMLPSILDAPARIACHALEDLDPGDPYGPRGAGEIGIGAVTPAIANAVADALGVAPAVTPFPPAAMLAALRAAEAAP